MDATTRQSLGQINLWTIYNTGRDIERVERDIEWEGKRDTRNEKGKGNIWNGKGKGTHGMRRERVTYGMGRDTRNGKGKGNVWNGKGKGHTDICFDNASFHFVSFPLPLCVPLCVLLCVPWPTKK